MSEDPLIERERLIRAVYSDIKLLTRLEDRNSLLSMILNEIGYEHKKGNPGISSTDQGTRIQFHILSNAVLRNIRAFIAARIARKTFEY